MSFLSMLSKELGEVVYEMDKITEESGNHDLEQLKNNAWDLDNALDKLKEVVEDMHTEVERGGHIKREFIEECVYKLDVILGDARSSITQFRWDVDGIVDELGADLGTEADVVSKAATFIDNVEARGFDTVMSWPETVRCA